MAKKYRLQHDDEVIYFIFPDFIDDAEGYVSYDNPSDFAVFSGDFDVSDYTIFGNYQQNSGTYYNTQKCWNFLSRACPNSLRVTTFTDVEQLNGFKNISGVEWEADNGNTVLFTPNSNYMEVKDSEGNQLYYGTSSPFNMNAYTDTIVHTLRNEIEQTSDLFCGITYYKNTYRGDEAIDLNFTNYGGRTLNGLRILFEGIDPSEPSDPYDPGGDSKPGGGGGDYDNESDPVDIPPLPEQSVVDTGFVSLYNPSLLQLKNLASYMWSSSLFDPNTFQKIFANPMDAILGLTALPLHVPTGLSTAVKVGNITTGVAMFRAAKQYIEVDCGTLNLKEYWGAYLDYSPYTKIDIYLPGIGVRSLTPDEVINKTLKVVYHVDVLSGACVCFIKCGSSVLYTYTGTIGTQIPFTSASFTSAISSIIALTGSVVGAAASGGMSAPAAAGLATSAASTVMNMKPDIARSGGVGGSASLMGMKKPYVIITRPRQCLPLNQHDFEGYPSYITRKIGDCSGFLRVEEVHLENLGVATQEEKAEIETLLKSGVYVLGSGSAMPQVDPDEHTFDIMIQKNNSENVAIGKSLNTIITVNGVVKNETSIIDPTFLIESDEDIMTANYVTIPIWERRYFIKNIRVIRSGLYEISCHVDVLESFKLEIFRMNAIIQRTGDSTKWNLYVDDGAFKVYQNPLIQTKEFPSGFSDTIEYVLAIAGD